MKGKDDVDRLYTLLLLLRVRSTSSRVRTIQVAAGLRVNDPSRSVSNKIIVIIITGLRV